MRLVAFLLVSLLGVVAARADDRDAPPRLGKSSIRMAQPRRWLPVEEGLGYRTEDKKAYVLLVESVLPFDSLVKRRYTKEKLAFHGKTELDRSTPRHDGCKALRVTAKWARQSGTWYLDMRVLGDDRRAAAIWGACPWKDREKHEAMLKQTLDAAQFDPLVTDDDPDAPLPFRMAGSKRLARFFAHGDYTGWAPKDADTGGDFAGPFILVYAVSGRVVRDGERGTYPSRIQRKLPWAKDVRQERSEPVEIDGLPGFMTPCSGTQKVTDEKLVLLSWVLYDDPTGYFHIVAGCPESQKTRWLGELKRMAASFERRR